MQTIDWISTASPYVDARDARVFNAHFGTPIVSVHRIWRFVEEEVSFLPLHLLITLHWLKQYPIDDVGSRFFHMSTQTWRSYYRQGIRVLLCRLPKV